VPLVSHFQESDIQHTDVYYKPDITPKAKLLCVDRRGAVVCSARDGQRLAGTMAEESGCLPVDATAAVLGYCNCSS